MENEENKIIHPGIKDSRVLAYLNCYNSPEYVNNEQENALLQLWRTKYYIAQSEYEKSRANSRMVNIWRQAYEGIFYRLDEEGRQTETRLKAIRKLAFELIEGKVNSNIPAPKMSPRYHADLVPVNATEELLKHEIDHMLSEELNDEAEHHVLIDGTVWFKVNWNPFDNTHERSGNPLISVCPIDMVYPQPGVKDYKKLEYIFERTSITVAECLDLYNRVIKSPTQNDIIPIINCYFLNEDRYVGKFTWCEETSQVICNDLEWGIRKRRECMDCHHVIPFENECPICGSHDIKYISVKDEILQEDLQMVVNPYRTGTSQDANDDQNQIAQGSSISAGTVIPHYLVRQLPFIPYRRISVPGSIYGMSEVEVILEDQDLINKLLVKAENKSASSKTYVTKLKDTNVTTDNDEISFVEVESPQEGQSIQVKQVMSDISQEITEAQLLYELAKSTVGITDTDQGKTDPTARSGKAKQLQMQASAKRNIGPDTMRNLAYSGLYELIFKYLLAFSDEVRSYVSLLPDGTQMEECWSKYMFLNIDNDGEMYYRDDYAWQVDTATEITQDRASMWQLIDNDYLNGTMGTTVDPNRALLMYWQMKDQCGYPLGKYALSFLKESTKHLPSNIEKLLVENPEAVELAMSFIRDRMENAGLLNSKSAQTLGSGEVGRPSNNATHAANVEKTNNKNRAQNGNAQSNAIAMATGGMQGGTGNISMEGQQ